MATTSNTQGEFFRSALFSCTQRQSNEDGVCYVAPEKAAMQQALSSLASSTKEHNVHFRVDRRGATVAFTSSTFFGKYCFINKVDSGDDLAKWKANVVRYVNGPLLNDDMKRRRNRETAL